MNKIFPIAIGVVIVMVLVIWLPALTHGVDSFRTDVKSQDFTVATAVGVTTANVSLKYSLWNGAVTDVTSLSSNNSTDAPVASSYNGTGYILSLTGLSANTTRTISVGYKTAGLTPYQGAETVALKLPTIVVVFIVMIPLGLLVAVLVKH